MWKTILPPHFLCCALANTPTTRTEGRRLTRAPPVVETQWARRQGAGPGQQQVRRRQRWRWQRRQQHLLSSILPQLLAHRHNQTDQAASATGMSGFHFRIPTSFSAQNFTETDVPTSNAPHGHVQPPFPHAPRSWFRQTLLPQCRSKWSFCSAFPPSLQTLFLSDHRLMLLY